MQELNLIHKIAEPLWTKNYNPSFLSVIKKSFITYLKTNPRSNAKLKILHGFIASTLLNLLSLDSADYSVESLNSTDGKESAIIGRYMEKKVDIVVKKRKKVIAGIAVKFVMSNYFQNSNNYFESMLGETANIRSNKIPYFQIFIIMDKIPYYDNQKNIKKWECIDKNELNKYINLSSDNPDVFIHTPNKTLVCVANVNDCGSNITNYYQYRQYYLQNNKQINFNFSNKLNLNFNDSVIYNDFDTYIKKIAYFIFSL